MEIQFNSIDECERGFGILCALQQTFAYVGNDTYEITEYQKNSLDIECIHYKII